MDWQTIEFQESITYKQDGCYYHVKLVKNIKGNVMCEVKHFESKAMMPLEKLPEDVQAKIKKHLPE
jgi:hypothetical protein